MPQVLGVGHMGQKVFRSLQATASRRYRTATRKLLGSGALRRDQWLLLLPGWLSISSGPEGGQGHPPLLLLLEPLVGSVQVLEHLQQAGSYLSLPGQHVRAGPWEGDKGVKGALPGQGGRPQPTPVAVSRSRLALCPQNPSTHTHTHTHQGQLVD